MEAQINICPEIYRTMMVDTPKGASGIVYMHACWHLANVLNRTRGKEQPSGISYEINRLSKYVTITHDSIADS
jgi:hypothetical protein